MAETPNGLATHLPLQLDVHPTQLIVLAACGRLALKVGNPCASPTVVDSSFALADAMLPYTSWLCLFNRAKDPYCNKSSAVTDPNVWPNVLYSQQQQATVGDKEYWPTPLPPMAPIASFVAVIDGSHSGLPDTPIRLMQAGRVNTSPRCSSCCLFLLFSLFLLFLLFSLFVLRALAILAACSRCSCRVPVLAACLFLLRACSCCVLLLFLLCALAVLAACSCCSCCVLLLFLLLVLR